MQNILNLEQAAIALQQERIIAYPTETFYAIGGLALSSTASRAVFAAKGRPGGQPLPVIIGKLEQLPLLARNISNAELDLANQFWPGPLSILFQAGPLAPAELLCNSLEVAIRQTPHPGAAELCCLAGPLSSSSANLSGQPAVREASCLDPELTPKLAGVLNISPQPPGGLPSTLVKVIGAGKVQIIRPGAVSIEQLAEAGWKSERHA